eukprot:g10623.t1
MGSERRKLVLQWHPDKHPQNREAAEEKIREINDAYETLSNPFKRSQYDNMLVALERKAKGFRLDTTMIKPRMSIPKEFMLSPLGYPDKFVRVVGMSLFVQSRGDAKAEFYDFFKEDRAKRVNNMCRIRPQATAGVGQDGGLNFNFALSRQVSVSEARSVRVVVGSVRFFALTIMQAPPPWLMSALAKLPSRQQQQVQELLMRVMKDMFLPALATVPAAWVLAYVPHFVKLGVVLSKQRLADYNNRDPRSTNPEEFGSKAALVRRCFACHVNALESFPAFALAVLLCKTLGQRDVLAMEFVQDGIKPFEAFNLCIRYLAARILYTMCYILGTNDVVAALRSLIWMDSILSIGRLYMKALTVILSPGQMAESAHFIAVASDVFKGAFRFECYAYPGHYLAFLPPTHLRVVGGTVEEKTAIDFMLVDYAKMFQYITVEEVLTPAVTKLGGQQKYVSLDDLRQDKNVRLYFENVQKKPIWADEDQRIALYLFFGTRANEWDYDARRAEVRLRSKHEQMAQLLRRARNVAEVAAAISASYEDWGSVFRGPRAGSNGLGEDEFKCTHRYDAGVDGKVYLQCQVHPKTEKLFNCLASKRCIPNGDVKFDTCQSKMSRKKCKSCDAGYIFGADGSTCKMKQCTCLLDGKNAGEGASGISCDTDGMMPGTITKRCLCTAGTGAPATGAACESHQANKCISCNTDGGFKMGDDGKTCVCDAGRGFEAADNTCVYKDCSCANGRKAVGVDCPKHLSTKCLSCEAGYRLVKDQCLKNVCTCPDGTAVFGAACDVHDKHQCTTCDKGYELIDDALAFHI